MGEMIDIRDENYDHIDRIKFSSNEGLVTCTIWNPSEGRIRFVNEVLNSDYDIDIRDIDNLIKALKKAKELWG